MNSLGVLLVNLGSPDSPLVGDVRRYLGEFLMDERVLDSPWLLRYGIVNFMILPSRSAQSAEAYESIWTREGSPLIVTSRNVRAELQKRVTVPVELAMRYQNPTIPAAVERLRARGVSELLVIPMFPHYAMSSFESAVERVREVVAADAPEISLEVLPPYYNDPGYLDALAARAKEFLASDYDHFLFSFHGLPERHLRKSDPTGCHCLRAKNCCAANHEVHRTCYRAQCFKTVEGFVQRTGVREYSVAFQSRLGKEKWLQPYTDQVLERLAGSGVRKLLVMCPAFVSDCLETLEEIGLRGKETFLRHGGKEFTLIPCLNDHPAWIDVLANMVARFCGQNGKHSPISAMAWG